MARTVPHLDYAGLRRVLETRKGARIITLVTITVPAMRKSDNPYFGLVERVVRRNGMCGAGYESSVNRRREKEGQPADDEGLVMQFTSLPLPWGEHDGPHFVKHTPKNATEPKYYLKFLPNRNLQDQWRHALTKQPYEPADVEAIKTFLRVSGGSSRQEIANQVDWRTIALDSIEQITIDGELYVIDHPQTPAVAAVA